MITATDRYKLLRSDEMKELLVEQRGICGGFISIEDISDDAIDLARKNPLFKKAEQYSCPSCGNVHTVNNIGDTIRCVETQQPLQSFVTSQPGWRLNKPPIVVERDNGENILLIESTSMFDRAEYPNVTDIYSLDVESRKSDGVITLHPLENFFEN